MRAAAERIDTGPRTGIGVLKAPPPCQCERRRAAFDELDNVFRIPGGIVAYPEAGAAMFGHDREIEAFGRRVFRCVFVGQTVIEIERASRVLGCSHARDHPDNLALGENEWLNKSREECLRELIALGYPKVFLKADGPLMSKSIADGELYPTALLAVIPVSADLRVVAINSTRVANVDATDTGALSATMPALTDQVWNCQSFVQKRVPGFEDAVFAGIAPRIGIRETRRIVGEETLNGDDVLNAVKREDGVAKGGHHIDIHGGGIDQVRRPVRDGGSYDIPLGCLLPKGIENMGIAGRCLSADRRAHGSARVMGTCIAMGQAVGTAAAMVCESNVPKPVLGDVPLPALRDRLVSQGAILEGTH